MDIRIETYHADPDGVATGYLINRGPTMVYWITCDPNVFLTACSFLLYDGFDATGREKWEGRPGQSRQYNFIPPIQCSVALFVDADADAGTFTVGYRPRKWDRGSTYKEDVIENPDK